MKTSVLDLNGKEKETIDLPKCFSEKIREDLIAKVLEAKKIESPYSPSLKAGRYSASGILIHRRHVWKSQYGRGISRIPRKIMSRRGSQFNWEGASIPSTKGGRRAHPPKGISRINTLKINKKEMKLAFKGALSATADKEKILKKYKSLEDLKIKNIPFVVDSKILSLKTKELISSIKKILGDNLFKIALRNKKIRSGKGKLRGRKYKTNAGLLIVLGEKEKLKAKAFEVANSKNLSILNLAKGGIGRLTIYTKQAIKEIGEKFK
ncbi:50S ribosomal protein L4 [Candidatus Pacearchaeota archaeon]|nr:MAG: 50S ribosomal protein L4 [Candidatus Pacearchaeota archaeon]